MLFGTVSALAEGYDAGVSISGDHRVTNNESLKTGRHTFVLTADDGCPMPSDSTGNTKEVTIDSNGSFDFGRITFDKPGTYTYTVSRKTVKTSQLKEDDSVYKCKVASFSDGTTIMVFEKVGSEGKPDRIRYEDTYIKPTDGTKVKTGDTSSVYVYGGLFTALIVLILGLRKKLSGN